MATAPTAAFLARAERIGGERPHMLFHLSVTAPIAATWYAATKDLDADALYAGSPAYRALIRTYSPIPAASALGGLSSGVNVTLEMEDALDASGKRFFDAFAANVPGYAEPYDVLTLALEVWVTFPGLTSADRLQLGRQLVLAPEGMTRGAGQVWSLTFIEDETRWKPLPRRTLTRDDWPDLPESSEGLAIPYVFGQLPSDVDDPATPVIPMIPLTEDGGLFLISEDGSADVTGATYFVVRQDQESQAEVLETFVEDDGLDFWLDLSSGATTRTLNAVAQRFKTPAIGAWVRHGTIAMAKSGAPAGVGSLTYEIVEDKDGLPSATRLSPGASSEIDAADVTNTGAPIPRTFRFKENDIERAVYLPPNKYFWAVIRYANDGGGALLTYENATGSDYADGYMAKLVTGTDDEWIIIGKQKRRGPVRTTFDGIGYLLNSGTRILLKPPVKRQRDRGVRVGVVRDAAPSNVTRAFIRFKISDWPDTVISARLNLTLLKMASPTGDLSVIEIEDFGTLTEADWSIGERGVINASALTPASAEKAEHSVDVTSAYTAAKVDGLDYFAVKLQYDTESEGVGDGRWYLIGAAGRSAPSLIVTLTEGRDLRITIQASSMTPGTSTDQNGHDVVALQAGDSTTQPPAGADVRLAVAAGGPSDANVLTSGTGRVVEGPRIIEYLARAPEPAGLGLDAADVDHAGFAVSLTRLAGRFPLTVYVPEQMDPRALFAEIAKACQSVVYIDEDGKLAIWTEPNAGGTPVRTVRPWEHRGVSLRPLQGAGGATWPVTRVEVHYARDWVGLQPSEEVRKRTRPTGYEGYAILSNDKTDPPDAARQAQAVTADARYGQRMIGDAGVTHTMAGPSPETSYAYVPMETASTGPTGHLIRDELWDAAQTRAALAQVLEVDLPWFAMGWRLMDEFNLEAYEFPSGFARVLPTTAFALGETTVAPDLYQARSARCQVRQITIGVGAGSDFPVHVTALIRAWNTA